MNPKLIKAQLDQLSAATARDLAQADSAKVTRLSTQVELIRKLVPALSLAYGVVVAFLYFFGEINFFPAGVNVGDALLLMFLAFGYGVLTFVFVGHGLILMTPASVFYGNLKSEHWRKLPKFASLSFCAIGPGLPVVVRYLWEIFVGPMQEASSAALWAVVFFLAVAAFFVLYLARSIAKRISSGCGLIRSEQEEVATSTFSAFVDLMAQGLAYWVAQVVVLLVIIVGNSPGLVYVLFASIAGLALVVAMRQVDEKDIGSYKVKGDATNTAKVFILLAGMAALLPLLWDSTQGERGLAKTVFERLGLRVTNGTLHVSSKALSVLKGHAAINDTKLFVCPMLDGSALVSPVTVLWHGMGRTSLLEMAGTGGRVQIEIPSEGVNAIRNEKARCHELNQKIHFASGLAEPVQESEIQNMQIEFAKVLNSLPSPTEASGGWVLDRAMVAGNTDPLPFGDAGNELLARRRAERVAASLKRVPELEPRLSQVTFDMRANGSREILDQCDVHMSKNLLSECHSKNRRASVRLLFLYKEKIDK